jgi:hypothetical protein
MTLSTMANNLMRFAPGLNPDILKSTLQDTYRQLCSKDWARLHLIRQVPTVIPYATGTVSIDVNGVVTGVGTAFTSAMEGRWMRVYYDDCIFEIQTYTTPTSITLRNWTGEIVTGASYSIFKTIYSADALFGELHNIIYQIPLKKVSQSWINKLDPGRLSTSSSPTRWAFAGVTSAGVIQFEIWPVPTTVISLRMDGKIKASTLADSDTPYLPEDLIEAKALLTCYELKELQQPGVGWAKKKADQSVTCADLQMMYEEEDYRLQAIQDKVKDKFGESLYPSDDNFALSHDID